MKCFVKKILGPSEIIGKIAHLMDRPTHRLWKVLPKHYWAHPNLLAAFSKTQLGPHIGFRRFFKEILGPSKTIKSLALLIDRPTHRLRNVPLKKYWAHLKLLAASIKTQLGPCICFGRSCKIDRYWAHLK